MIETAIIMPGVMHLLDDEHRTDRQQAGLNEQAQRAGRGRECDHPVAGAAQHVVGQPWA